VTLVELLVVLALLGLILGISGVALASLREPQEAATLRALERARGQAIATGEPVAQDSVLFLPDGRAIGPSVDPLTGVPHAR
jgi:Tfp pilus assembly protein FimT